MRKLWEFRSAVEEAIESLEYASKMAYECSGDDPGTAAVPEENFPALRPTEGWPALVKLSDLFGTLAEAVRLAVPPEVEAAIKAEHDEDADRESPEALGLRP